MSNLPDLYIFSEIGSVRSDLRDLPMLSVAVDDLQALYNLQDLYDLSEWNLCDLYDMCTPG